MNKDISKIPHELTPSFKGSLQARDELLTQQLGDLALFWVGIPESAGMLNIDAADVWRAVVRRHGESAVFQFCVSARTVNKLQEAFSSLIQLGHEGMALTSP